MGDRPVGTAFVEVRPDLRGFEAELSAALKRALAGATATGAGTARAATGEAALGAATRGTTRALSEQAKVMQVNSTELARFSRGVAATTLSTFGLRGATLAATSSFLAGAAAITALAKAVGLATSFNSQLAVFAATTGATADEMNAVSEAAKALGRDLTLPGVTATDAATAMTELAKAGLSVKDSIAGARGVLQLAGAANIDFAQATEIAASAINAFQLAGRDAGKVADVLANAANSAQGSIVDVGIAFQQAAAIGHQVGLTFQDTTLFITELAKAGLTGSDAGTSLRTALIRLINPTKKAQEIFKDLNISVRDAAGNLRPDFFTNLGVALQGMSKKQRDATLAIIGGQDAVRALSILSRASAKDLISMRDALDVNGTAAKVNAARMTGLKGASAGLQNTIEGLALSLGQKATPSLIGATTALTGFITAVAQSPAIDVLGETFHVIADAVRELGSIVQTTAPVIQGFIGGLADVAHAVGPQAILAGVAAYLAFGVAVGTIIPKIAALVSSIRGLIAVQAVANAAAAAGAIETASFGAAALAAATGPTALAIGIAAAVAGLVFLITRESEAEKATKALKAATSDLADAYRDQAAATQTAADAQSALKTDKLNLASTKLAVTEARRAVAQAKLKGDTFQIAQAENGLAIALDNVRLAQKRVADDTRAANEAKASSAQASKNAAAAQLEESKALQRVAEEIAATRENEARGFLSEGSTAKAIQDVIDKIKERAAAERAANTESGRLVAQRLDALAKLGTKIKDLPTAIHIVLNAPSLDAGLKVLESHARASGDRAGAAFVEQFRIELNPSVIGQSLGDLPGVFDQLGKTSGDNFSKALLTAVQNAISLVNRLIIQGATQLTIQLSNQVDTLLQNVQRTELTGGSLDQQLSAAKEARARAERELAAADAAVAATHGRSQAAKKRQQKAIQDLASASGDVDRIQGEITAKEKAAADARKKKIDDAQKAKDQADQDFLTLMGESRGPIDLAIESANLTKGLQDDINAQLALQNFLRQQIAAANATIKDVHLRIQTVQQLTVALIQSQVATKNLVEQQKQAAKQAIIDKRDRQEESLELDVQIADATKNRAKELKAHQALLKFLIDRQKHTDRGSVEWKRLQLKIEQERAAIKDAQKATKARADALKALEFEFLQTQTGFVANLLGNLLPFGAVAGTVGGTTAGGASATAAAPGGTTVPSANFATAVHQRPTDVPPAAFATAVHQRGKIDKGFSTAAQTGASAGASFGQMSVLIGVARAQLAVLRALTGRAGHPEATIQRSVQNAGMDTINF